MLRQLWACPQQIEIFYTIQINLKNNTLKWSSRIEQLPKVLDLLIYILYGMKCFHEAR